MGYRINDELTVGIAAFEHPCGTFYFSSQEKVFHSRGFGAFSQYATN